MRFVFSFLKEGYYMYLLYSPVSSTKTPSELEPKIRRPKK